jgi:hypothetical protein
MTESDVDIQKGRLEALAAPSGENGFTMAGLAEVFVQSGFFKDIKAQSQAIVKILLGKELGLKPIQSVLAVHMVEGRPEIAAATLGALIKRSGKYDYRVIEHTAEACSIEFFEVSAFQDGGPGALLKKTRESIGISRFEMADAVRAGLAHKSNYKSYPKNMMFARALSNGVKWYCLDAIGSIPVYTEGEVPEVETISGNPAPTSEPFPELEPRELVSAPVTPSTSAGEVVEPRPEPADSGRAGTAQGPVLINGKETSALAVEDPVVQFELNGVTYQTAGATRDQMLSMFDLGPKANKRVGKKGYDKTLLLEKFNIATRKDLTAEQAEQYIALLQDAVGAE